MLPTIDFAPFRAGGAQQRRKVATEIDDACESAGFMYLRNHGVDQDVIDEALDACRDFFALDEAEKRRYARALGEYRGFIAPIPFGYDRNAGSAILYEAFIVGHDIVPDDPRIGPSKGVNTPNVWPVRPAGFRDAVGRYFSALDGLAMDLTTAFSMALGVDEETLGRFFAEPISNMTLLHYLPRESAPAAPREHFDTNAYTILLPGEAGGLEVRFRGQDWVEVPPLAGSFVVNIGSMLECWSGGRWRSTLHRVQPPPARDRYSIGFFASPDYDTVVEPLVPVAEHANPGRIVALHAGESMAEFIDSCDQLAMKQTEYDTR
jgi:isopenicillin N synthase-like dioxygenase